MMTAKAIVELLIEMCAIIIILDISIMKCRTICANRGNKIIAQICWTRYAGFTTFKRLKYDDSPRNYDEGVGCYQ